MSVAARASDLRSIRAPWDGREVGRVPVASADDVERALAKTHAAFEAARRAPPPRHLAIAVLEKAAALIAADGERLARLICDEAGKPMLLARAEVARCVDTFTTARDVARTASGEVLELSAYAASEDRLALVRRMPIGVVTAITPFNFPLNLVAHKLAPAIAAGCPVVLKPSPQAPLSAFALAEVLYAAGLPDDRLVVVACSNEDAAPLVTDARPRLFTFTGSAKVGWDLRARCGEKRCTLELGGNAAVIVHDDADLEHATARIVAGAFGYAGQSCISVQRILAHRRIYDELRTRLFEATARLTMFDPAREETVCGPVIDDTAVARIRSVVDEALSLGAAISAPLQIDRHTLSPFFLEGVPVGAGAAREELFGPGALLDPYDDFEEALDRADAGNYGLQAGLFTRDLGRVIRAWERIEVGAVICDDVPTFRADAMPYGGLKGSGVGREGPAATFVEMTESRLLLLRNVQRT